MSEVVLYEQEGGVVTLTLNEPDTRNAISPAIVDALVDYVARINADLSVGCVILTGAGKGFSSGGNVNKIKERSTQPASPVEVRRGYQQNIQRVPLALYSLEAPLIAAVNGAAVGVGCDLATMCDIRIAGRSAKFAESFLRVGLISGDGGAWYLPRAVGLSKAYEMTFTGRFVEADEAARIGLVSKVVDDDRLLEEACAMAREIAAQPVHSLRLAKRLMRDSQQISLPLSLDIASSMQALAHHTKDQQEAVAAFMEKRVPQFRGC
jgi:enoyl-CoA hydratase/carnithine racemase